MLKQQNILAHIAMALRYLPERLPDNLNKFKQQRSRICAPWRERDPREPAPSRPIKLSVEQRASTFS